ncbi:hypothetical protein B0H19DRAFT_1065717 [Mycena capillaripes]|nr:hypothetical protein B0H19DRAFT_1065717 [Mycena capillaripes]
MCRNLPDLAQICPNRLESAREMKDVKLSELISLPRFRERIIDCQRRRSLKHSLALPFSVPSLALGHSTPNIPPPALEKPPFSSRCRRRSRQFFCGVLCSADEGNTTFDLESLPGTVRIIYCGFVPLRSTHPSDRTLKFRDERRPLRRMVTWVGRSEQLGAYLGIRDFHWVHQPSGYEHQMASSLSAARSC